MRIVGARTTGDRHAVILDNGQELEGVSSIASGYDRMDDTVELRLIVRVRMSDIERFSSIRNFTPVDDWRRDNATRGRAAREASNRDRDRRPLAGPSPPPEETGSAFDGRRISQEMMERIERELIHPPSLLDISFRPEGSRPASHSDMSINDQQAIDEYSRGVSMPPGELGVMRGATIVNTQVDETARFVVGDNGALEEIEEDVFIIDGQIV